MKYFLFYSTIVNLKLYYIIICKINMSENNINKNNMSEIDLPDYSNDRWITNGYRKVASHHSRVDLIDPYTGELLNAFDFKRQTNNYNKIIKLFEDYNIRPTQIYYSLCDCNVPDFVVCWTNPNIMWQKFHYHSRCNSGANNFIFYKNHKIHTTDWLKMTKEQVDKLLSE